MYRESTHLPLLDTLFFLQNAQDTWKCVILNFFHYQNIINTRNYILNVEKIEEIALLKVKSILKRFSAASDAEYVVVT